jgi:transcriptional regulator with XRE-family HTH domain
MSIPALVAQVSSGANLTNVATSSSSKKSKLTDEHRTESRMLKALWDQSSHGLSQDAFGHKFGIGSQGMVWQCLNGTGSTISLKAARGFARGLKVEVSAFSPRLAATMAEHAAIVGAWPFPDIERARFDRLTEHQRIEIQGIVRERIEKFEAANDTQPAKPLGVPIAKAKRSAAEALSDAAVADRNQRRAKTHVPTQRRRPAA